MPEKRSYIRFVAKGDITLHPENNPAKILKGDLVNMSFLGLAANLKRMIETDITVRFELTTSYLRTPLSGKGKIIYMKEIIEENTRLFRVGVMFTDIDENLVKRLLNTIQYEINLQKNQKKKSF